MRNENSAANLAVGDNRAAIFSDDPHRALLMYLGRRGPLGRFTLDLSRALDSMSGIRASFIVSRMNPASSFLGTTGAAPVRIIETIETGRTHSALTNFFAARWKLLDFLSRENPSEVINLMPHIWTPLFGGTIQRRGIRYTVIIHDAVAHPGDNAAILTPWLRAEAKYADRVIVLSEVVRQQLLRLRLTTPKKLRKLFHPDLRYGDRNSLRRRADGAPFSILFFGRVLRYKGLPLLIEAIELLRAQGMDVRFGVAGVGNIEKERPRLAELGAEVINRWLEDDEIGPLLGRYDAMALPYLEASQSGVAATAFGDFMPVVGLPTLGIVEQVVDGKTGVLAAGVDAWALAEAIKRLATNSALYESISQHLCLSANERSMQRFAMELMRH